MRRLAQRLTSSQIHHAFLRGENHPSIILPFILGKGFLAAPCVVHQPMRFLRSRSTTPASESTAALESEMSPHTKRLGDLILASGTVRADTDENLRRVALSRAITLVESQSSRKRQQADLLLQYLVKKQQELSHDLCDGTGDDFMFRVGIAGPPGAGKSSFIEKLGLHVLGKDADGKVTRLEPTTPSSPACSESSLSNAATYVHYPSKLAVVCIDPSSTRSGGSILGDKTRMEQLSRHGRAFVRPSPSRGTLGGLANYTNDVVMLYQLADYHLVIVETVGLGQSEVDVDNTVDMSILLLAPGCGDELQGVKKGIVEIADMLVVNKANGVLLPAARSTAADYKNAMNFQRRKVQSWNPPVLLASAHTGTGICKTWEEICRFREEMLQNGELAKKRKKQAYHWMWKNIEDLIAKKTQSDPVIREKAATMEKALESGLVTPRVAATEILEAVLEMR